MKLSSFLAYINNICFESVGEALVQCDAGAALEVLGGGCVVGQETNKNHHRLWSRGYFFSKYSHPNTRMAPYTNA